MNDRPILFWSTSAGLSDSEVTQLNSLHGSARRCLVIRTSCPGLKASLDKLCHNRPEANLPSERVSGSVSPLLGPKLTQEPVVFGADRPPGKSPDGRIGGAGPMLDRGG